ncbi:UNVERIFIED_CONTAM: GRAS family protein RAM1 [Sesamum radiatum]|uniref:GRAS family protein RAM1 n=1 Tax=Sesamum radiatum TaxID=300843 RepID=A0AAW2K311_SESRA
MGGLMNGWLTLPTFENLNQDSAIRRFCPARVEQEQGGAWGDSMLVDEDVEIWPHLIDETPQLAPSEVEEIVRTFFDVECYEKDNAEKCLEEEGNDNFDKVREDGLQDLLMVDDELCCGLNAAMLIEEGCDEMERCGSTDDLGSFVPNNAEDMIPVGVDEGLQLVHLLLACAEAVGCRDTQLVDSILTQIWPCVNTWGDSLQRVSHCFAMGLKSRLSLLQNVNSNGFFASRAAFDVSLITREEKIEAFTLLHQTTPYIAFGLMAANDAISQAAAGKDFLHIIDLGMEHNLQWPCLVRTLASRTDAPPKSIRITGITGDHDTSELENSMKGLSEEAISLGISLEFQFLAEQVSPLSLTREKLELRQEEAVFVNSIMHLHKHVKESRGSLKTILQSVKKLNPVLLTVVEQDANHNGPFFLGRFLESLHYYSAIFDSLDASLPRNSQQRIKIEKFHFAEEIRNVVAYEGSDRVERHERADQWRRQIGRAGFQVVGLKCLKQAKMMVCGYGVDGYSVGSEKGCLQLGWKGRPIMIASAWQVHNVPS